MEKDRGGSAEKKSQQNQSSKARTWLAVYSLWQPTEGSQSESEKGRKCEEITYWYSQHVHPPAGFYSNLGYTNTLDCWQKY